MTYGDSRSDVMPDITQLNAVNSLFKKAMTGAALATTNHLVRVVIQHFSKNTVISMVLGHPNSEITCIPPS